MDISVIFTLQVRSPFDLSDPKWPQVDLWPLSVLFTLQVGFSCIRTDDPTTAYRKMKDQSFTNKPADIIREVEVPQRCNCLNTCIDAAKLW